MKKSSVSAPAPISLEWLQLETAVELIGQMISNKVSLYMTEQDKKNPNPEIINQLQSEIAILGKERRACYRSETQKEMIDKAHNVYAQVLAP